MLYNKKREFLTLLDGKNMCAIDNITKQIDTNTPQKCIPLILLNGKSICNFDRAPCTCTSDKECVPKESDVKELLLDISGELQCNITLSRMWWAFSGIKSPRASPQQKMAKDVHAVATLKCVFIAWRLVVLEARVQRLKMSL
jgi:hypothetical protein